MPNPEPPPVAHSYFVDETGDPNCFDRKKRIIVGEDGVSKCFLVGAALIYEPEQLGAKLEVLRASIIADPYFAGVPSLALARGRTTRQFHAKDDPPEVRQAVFRLLREAGGVEMYVAFRRKRILADELRAFQERTGRKRGPDALYDELVSAVFETRLHQADSTHIVFAARGKAVRNVALAGAIERARGKFERKWKRTNNRPVTVEVNTPSEVAGLQVVDYYLWALQRLLERGEPRFFNFIAPAFRLILDRDDTRERPYGEYYTSKRPLTPEAMMPVT